MFGGIAVESTMTLEELMDNKAKSEQALRQLGKQIAVGLPLILVACSLMSKVIGKLVQRMFPLPE